MKGIQLICISHHKLTINHKLQHHYKNFTLVNFNYLESSICLFSMRSIGGKRKSEIKIVVLLFGLRVIIGRVRTQNTPPE